MENVYSPATQGHHTQRWVKWNAPSEGIVTLNVDGSSFGNQGSSGFRGLFRDSNEVWLAGFIGSIGNSNNIHAELMGIYKDLNLAWDYGYRKVGGWTQEYAGLIFVAVRGAGHEVPLHRPKLALALIKAYLAGSSFARS